MKYSLLHNKMRDIQHQYKELLTTLLPILRDNFSPEPLDEIILFWKENLPLVKLYLQTVFSQYDCYVFTASSYVNLTSNEHYPFLLFGTHHAFDDPLCKYAELCNKMPSDTPPTFMQQQVIRTIENNIALMNVCEKEILVFPIRQHYSEEEEQELAHLVEELFLNLFPKFNSLEKYYEICASISDIIEHGIPNLANVIMFSEGEDPTEPIERRFQTAVEKMPAFPISAKTDAQKFFYVVYGHLFQALDIIISSERYHCFPYVEYPVACNYISLIGRHLTHVDFVQEMCYKMNISFMTYNLCDEDQLSRAGFSNFLVCRDTLGFSDFLFGHLEKLGITCDNYLEHSVREPVVAALSELYAMIRDHENV